MRATTIDKLAEITLEEQKILDGSHQVQKDIYSEVAKTFKIDSKKMIQQEQYLAIRPHTRFIDFPLHTHDFTEIMYVCQGSITHVIDDKEIVLYKGDIIFLNQHVKHEIKKAGIDDIGINLLVLPQFFDIPLSMLGTDNALASFIVNTLRKHTTTSEYLVFRTDGNIYIENLMENLILSFFEGNGMMQTNQITMGMIFLQLIHNMEYLGRESSKTYEEIIVNTAFQYIAEHYSDASLHDLSQKLYISDSWLSKIIKKKTGTNFTKLLQRKRVQKAAEFLADTDLTIEDIRNAVGYENSSHFYNQFREHYQMSPRNYRLRYKGNIRIPG